MSATTKSDRTTPTPVPLTRAVRMAEELGRALRRDFPHLASRRDALAVQRAFLRGWRPPSKRGRRRSSDISRAHQDWSQNGLTGLALARKYIPRFDRLPYWERKGRLQNLLAALRARDRRERLKAANKFRTPSA